LGATGGGAIRVSVGLTMYYGTSGGSLWIDELALDPQRIGCER
jgi:hypothetical protein